MDSWARNRRALQEHLKSNDLADFINWSTIQATMFVGDVGYVRKEYAEIMTDKQFTGSVIEETKAGHPPLMWGWTSGNLIHQYYHLKQWLDLTRQDIREMGSIVEVGAGYGAMALICHRLGFKGRYFIFDLPELVRLQRYYLWETIGDLDTIYWSFPLELCDLFIASHSLNEMPVVERERLLSQVAAKEYLFASSYEFDGVNNQDYFEQMAGSIQGIDWKFYPHRHQENAFYMVGIQL